MWAQSVGGNSPGNALKLVACDRNGDGVACGYFSGSNALNGATAPGALQDAMVVRYDSMGQLQWARTGGGSLSDFAECLALDRAGNAYITGSFHNSFTMGGTSTTTTNPVEQCFVAKLDRVGNVAFLKNPMGSRDDYGYGIGVDTNNACYVTGYFEREIAFDVAQLSSTNGAHTFVARLDPQQPTLLVQRGDGRVNFSWPLWAADFELEWKTDWAALLWTSFSTAPTNNGQQWVTGTNADLSAAFFRLRQR